MSDYRIHRYLTDDRHTVSRPHELVVMWAPNGDYYIGSAPEGQHMMWQGVRICTSGGASSRNPPLMKAVAAIFQALGGWTEDELKDRPDPESVAQQHLFNVTMAYHRVQRHNQHFERCEHMLCSDTREVLGIVGYSHKFNEGWKKAVEANFDFKTAFGVE